MPDSQPLGQNVATDSERLEQIVGERGRVSIERNWSIRALPWSVSFDTEDGRCGFGTGRTMDEAVCDAITDMETAA